MGQKILDQRPQLEKVYVRKDGTVLNEKQAQDNKGKYLVVERTTDDDKDGKDKDKDKE